MPDFRRFAFCALVACALTGAGVAQTPTPSVAKSDSQARFDASKDLYEKDIGYFNDAVTKLREANKNGGSMACSWADVAVVSLSSAQVELAKMITIVEEAHQDASGFRASYDENAIQFIQRKKSYDEGCS